MCEKRRTGRLRAALHTAAALAALLPLLIASMPAVRADAECDAGRHRYTVTRRIEATAAQDGEVAYLCSICGRRYTEILYATDHNWGAWVIDRQPSCTSPGERHRTCTRGLVHDEYDAIAALGHKYEDSATVEPGCGEEGVATYACARCGDTYTESIPPLEHSYEEIAERAPGCFEPGLMRFVCVHDPSHSFTQETEPFGSHSFGAWTVETPAEAGVEGLEARRCTRDGFRETRQLAALPVPKAFNAADVVLVTANVSFVGLYAFLIIPYILGLLYLKKRREAVRRRDALRKLVEEHYGFT